MIKVTLGADPELGIVDCEGKAVNARQFAKVIPGDGQFGIDGSQNVFEVRPTPSEEPFGVVKSIEKCLADGYARLTAHGFQDYRLVAGSMCGSYPIGGHIHFGARELKDDGTTTTINRVNAVRDVLNYYLGPTLGLLEPKQAFIARRRNYGALWGGDDIRHQPHGLEWRVPSSWLTTPAIAQSSLALAKMLVESSQEIHANNKTRIAANKEVVKSAFSSFDLSYLKKHITNEVIPVITGLKDYEKYKREADFIFKMIEDDNIWLGDLNVLSAWGLRSPKEDAILVKKALEKLKLKEVLF